MKKGQKARVTVDAFPDDILTGEVTKLGVLPDPALLVFRRPGDLVFRVNGFADRATVAQAAVNARP